MFFVSSNGAEGFFLITRVAEPKLFFPLRLRLSKSFRSGSGSRTGSGAGSGSDLSFEGACFHSF